MSIEFSDAELVVLDKALKFVRFQSQEYDARYLSASPHISEVYKRINEAVIEYYRSSGVIASQEWPFIEDVNGYIDVVKIRIKDTDNWSSLNHEQKERYVKVLTFPYNISTSTFIKLIEFGDQLHS